MTAPLARLRVSLPGVCRGCGAAVTWRGVRWLDADGRWHYCPANRTRCGAWMPRARERCARRPGHKVHHATRYALTNAAAWRRGVAA